MRNSRRLRRRNPTNLAGYQRPVRRNLVDFSQLVALRNRRKNPHNLVDFSQLVALRNPNTCDCGQILEVDEDGVERCSFCTCGASIIRRNPRRHFRENPDSSYRKYLVPANSWDVCDCEKTPCFVCNDTKKRFPTCHQCSRVCRSGDVMFISTKLGSSLCQNCYEPDTGSSSRRNPDPSYRKYLVPAHPRDVCDCVETPCFVCNDTKRRFPKCYQCLEVFRPGNVIFKSLKLGLNLCQNCYEPDTGSSSRRNPDFNGNSRKLSEVILRTLPQQAQEAFTGNGQWENRPSKRGGKPWANEDDFWSNIWYVPGWKIRDSILFRTIWRFNDSNDRSFISEYDVNDPNYFQLMEGFGEDARLSSWKDYLTWVIQEETDPLNKLNILEEEDSSEEWSLVFRSFEREEDKPIAVELIGAKSTLNNGGLHTPGSLPAWLIRKFRVNENKKLGAWLVGSYSNLEELISDLKAQKATIDRLGEDTCKATLKIETGRMFDRSAITPRTEALIEAARKAIRSLSTDSGSYRRNPDPDGAPWGPTLYNPLTDSNHEFKDESHYQRIISKFRRNPYGKLNRRNYG